MFEHLDLSRLYDTDSDFGKEYIFGELKDEIIKRAENNIGYKLPKSYVELLQYQNGGVISDNIDSWLTTIYGIGPESGSGNGLEYMFINWIEEWEYPNIGIPFGETQTAGHDMYFMDFRNLDTDGEPEIVLVENEGSPDDFKITFVAKNLKEFIEKVLNGGL